MAIKGQLGNLLPIKEDDVLMGTVRRQRKCRSKDGDIYYSVVVEIGDHRYRMTADEELEVNGTVECIWNDKRTFLAVYK